MRPFYPFIGNHDHCYLGKHNQIYEQPRQLLRAFEDMNLEGKIEVKDIAEILFEATGIQ